MRNKIIFFSFILVNFSWAEIFYNFQKTKPLYYNFQINGKVGFNYSEKEEEKSDVSLEGKLKIEMIDEENGIYTLKITPYKTLIKLTSKIIEDITNSETMVSSILTTSYVKMKKNGQIIETREETKGIVEFSEILKILPIFPEKLFSGKKWVQEVSSFKLPGIPVCSLKFNYAYKKGENFSSIILSANQKIDQIQKDKDIKIFFKGKNISNGTFYFNEKKGQVDKFDGKFSLNLDTKFELPQTPEENKKEIVPIKISLNLNISLKME